MISERKIQANRRNAQKSSGPQTKRGKAVSRMNALRHGITAEHVILDGESAKQFNALRRKLFEAFSPADAVEVELVQAIVMDQWRLRRHYRAEASLFTELGGGEYLGGGFQAAPQSLTTLIRYHAGIERSIHHNMAALERRQALRRSKPVPAPTSAVVPDPGEPRGEGLVVPAKPQAPQRSNPNQLSVVHPPARDKDVAMETIGTGSRALGDASSVNLRNEPTGICADDAEGA